MATSKTASSPPSSLNFSLKLPPVFLTAPEVSKRMQTQTRKQMSNQERAKEKEKSYY